MKVAVIADTHTRGQSRPVPAGAWPFLETADHILHAGDVVEPALLDELNSLAPLSVVMGNCDAFDVRAWGAREDVTLELGGVEIAMVHDSGAKDGRRARMRKRFPSARVVVFGHSHLPVNDDDGDLLLFNPGSATWKRMAPYTSMGLLWIDDGKVEGEIVPV
jgi:putative phosphoesterase